MSWVRHLFIFLLISGCGGGSDVGNPLADPSSGEKFDDEGNCTQEAFECSDGTILMRDPDLQCEFPECPEE